MKLLYKLDEHFHGCIALTLTNLNDTCVSAVAVSILCTILVKNLVGKICLLGISLAALSLGRNLGYIVENRKHLASCIELRRLILLDCLLYFIVNGDLLLYAVNLLGLLDTLAVGIFPG